MAPAHEPRHIGHRSCSIFCTQKNLRPFIRGVCLGVILMLFLLALILGHSIATTPPFVPRAGFHVSSSNHSFRITIFDDLHFGEDEGSAIGLTQDQATLKVMNTVLGAELPDLVVLNGDLISGEHTHPNNSTEYLNTVLGPIVDHNGPFAVTYGNHDNDVSLSTRDLYDLEKLRYVPLSLSEAMVNGSESDVGVSNYYLPVFFSNIKDTTPDLLIWFFDSRGGKEFKTGKQLPSQVSPVVVDWFKTTSAALQTIYNATIPAIAFVHLPVSTMHDFQTKQSSLFEENEIPGINEDSPVAAQTDDSAFINALVNDRSIKAVFSGHDHGDDWCMQYLRSGNHNAADNLFFCMGRHGGYGGADDWERGSRTVELDKTLLEKGELRTWMRFEDGSQGQVLGLNGTYGEDLYEKVPVRCTKLGKGVVPCP